MPGMGGREVLARLKADPALRCIPVIIFSSSTEQQDVEGAYADGANSYLFKPEPGEQLEATARALQSFWLAAARLPGSEGSRHEPPRAARRRQPRGPAGRASSAGARPGDDLGAGTGHIRGGRPRAPGPAPPDVC